MDVKFQRPKLLIISVLLLIVTSGQQLVQAAQGKGSERLFLPLVSGAHIDCSVPGQNYSSLSVNGPSSHVRAEENPDYNLGVRGYAPTKAWLGLVDHGPVADRKAPQFPALFADNRLPVFSNAYQRYRWDYDCNCPDGTYSPWDTTVLGMAVTPGELIHVPDSGYDIGAGYEVMVISAEETRITFNIGNRDRLDGYVMHIEDVCIEPRLLARYRSLSGAGRHELPALRGRQPFGRALGNEIKIAVRDNGHFLDPRSRNSWWQGR